MNSIKIVNIAFYRFVSIPPDDLPPLRKQLGEVCRKAGLPMKLKGTVLLSPEGINGFLAGPEEGIREVQEFLGNLEIGKNLSYKESYSDFIPFKRLLVKIKKEIIPIKPLGISKNPSDANTNNSIPATCNPETFTAPRISARELKKWLDENKDFELLDTRNEYEIEYGTFKKARHLGLRHFRHFPQKLNALPEESKTKPLVMFCTGGIRCEKASIVALQSGHQEVYQLDGGILKYFEECGGAHYEGDCFVFDQRVALDSGLKISDRLKGKNVSSSVES